MQLLTLPQKSIITDFLRNHPEFDAIKERIDSLDKGEAIKIIKAIYDGCGHPCHIDGPEPDSKEDDVDTD